MVGAGGRLSREKNWRVSCIHPRFHFSPNPIPRCKAGRVTIGHAVDSSAMVWTSG